MPVLPCAVHGAGAGAIGPQNAGRISFAIAVPKIGQDGFCLQDLGRIVQKFCVSPCSSRIARNVAGAKATSRAVSQQAHEAAILSGMKPFPRLLIAYLLAGLPAAVFA